MSSQRAPMSQSPSAEVSRCPECGAPLRAGESACWLCNSGNPFRDVMPPAVSGGIQHPPAGQFSLASIFLIITLIAVCLGSLRLAPGVGVLLIIVAVPALVRTCVVGSREKRSGHSLTIGQKLVAFLASTGIILLVGVAGVVAFQIACWGSCAAVFGIQQKESEGALITGIVAGTVAGLAAMIWLMWLTWPKRKR